MVQYNWLLGGRHNHDNRQQSKIDAVLERTKVRLGLIIRYLIADPTEPRLQNEKDVFHLVKRLVKEGLFTLARAQIRHFGDEIDPIYAAIEDFQIDTENLKDNPACNVPLEAQRTIM